MLHVNSLRETDSVHPDVANMYATFCEFMFDRNDHAIPLALAAQGVLEDVYTVGWDRPSTTAGIILDKAKELAGEGMAVWLLTEKMGYKYNTSMPSTKGDGVDMFFNRELVPDEDELNILKTDDDTVIVGVEVKATEGHIESQMSKARNSNALNFRRRYGADQPGLIALTDFSAAVFLTEEIL